MSIQTNPHYAFLREEIDHIPCVSSHDHLKTEQQAMAEPMDLFDYVFSSLDWTDMVSAGLPKLPQEGIGGPSGFPKPRDLDAMWKRYSPYLEHIREMTPYRTNMRGLGELLGFDEELGDSNWRGLNERLLAGQKQPGRYRDVFGKRENLRASLNDVPRTYAGTPPEDRWYTCNVMRVMEWTDLSHDFRQKGGLNARPIETLRDAEEAWAAHLGRIMAEGVIGLKMGQAYWRPLEFDDVPRAVAEKDFPRPDHQGLTPRTVQDYMANAIARDAGAHGLPVAFHTGPQYGNNGEIRNSRAQLLCPYIRRHPNTRFDVYHISYPYSDEALILCKYFPNAFFDFCGTDYLSPSYNVRLLHVALELLPSNKIFGFGADAGCIEQHVGCMLNTREWICECLAERIEAGRLTRPRAVRLLQKLLHDNAAETYRVEDWRSSRQR